MNLVVRRENIVELIQMLIQKLLTDNEFFDISPFTHSLPELLFLPGRRIKRLVNMANAILYKR